MKIFGKDPDELFAYQTPKIVVLKDKKLGLLKICLIVTIIIWIFVGQMAYQGTHLLMQDIDGTYRLTLHHPTLDSCDPFTVGCKASYRSFESLPYCTQSKQPFVTRDGATQAKGECQIWDSVESAIFLDQGMLLPTRIRRYEQTRDCEPSAANNFQCRGVPYEFTTGGQFQTKAGEPKPKFDAFVADIEEFTIMIDHQFRRYGLMQADDFEMDGYWNHCPGNRSLQTECTKKKIVCGHDACTGEDAGFLKKLKEGPKVPGNLMEKKGEVGDIEPFHAPLPGGEPVIALQKGDVFKVGTLLQAMNSMLDNTQGVSGEDVSLRHRGLILVIHITYENKPQGGWLGFKVTPWETPAPHYVYHISARSAFDYKLKKPFGDPADADRKVREYNGIRVAVEQSGKLVSFSIANFFLTFTTALGLIAVATTLTELVMANVMTKKELYKKRKYHISVDFNPEEEEEPKNMKKIKEAAGTKFLEAIDEHDGEKMRNRLDKVLAVKTQEEGWRKNGIDLAELQKHATMDDCWIVVNGKVLDITKCLEDASKDASKEASEVEAFAGKDASEEFKKVLDKYGPDAVPRTVVGDFKTGTFGTGKPASAQGGELLGGVLNDLLKKAKDEEEKRAKIAKSKEAEEKK